MKKLEALSMPFGMVGAAAYLIHVLLGQLLWPEYNWITTDISSLTAVDAPDRNLLLIFSGIYGMATVLFVAGMLVKSFRKYHTFVRTGWTIFLVMNLVSMFGYSLFPLTGDKTQMTFGNMMHIVVTVVVVFTTIAGGFILSIGYIKQEKMKRLGTLALVLSVLITITGVLNPIGLANDWNILGLTERAVIYSLQLLMFLFSAYYTFYEHEKQKR